MLVDLLDAHLLPREDLTDDLPPLVADPAAGGDDGRRAPPARDRDAVTPCIAAAGRLPVQRPVRPLGRDGVATSSPPGLQHAKRWSNSAPAVPYGKNTYFVSTRNVVDLVPRSLEQDATRTRYRRLPIQTSDLRCLADDVERCCRFFEE